MTGPIRIVGIIPTHLASVRFPRKVLHPILGLPMVEHVRRRALLCESISNVYVATCDNEIAESVSRFGADVIMTSDSHQNGTTRVAEAVRNIDCTHVILLQGDEPLMLPRHLNDMVDSMNADIDGQVWNATGPIESPDELQRHSFVKCIVTSENKVVFCFRKTPLFCDFDDQRRIVRKILGLIAYKKNFLMKVADLSPTPIEELEFIEQMRIIENGFDLRSVPVEPSLPSINEPEEVEIVLKRLKENEEQRKLLDKISRSY